MPPTSASVVIIGAGIVACSVAYHLSARGCKNIVVLEKADTEVAGSTARSAAGVRHQFATEVNILLSRYSIERMKRFTAEVGGEAGLKQIGYLLLVSEPDRWEQYQRSVATFELPASNRRSPAPKRTSINRSPAARWVRRRRSGGPSGRASCGAPIRSPAGRIPQSAFHRLRRPWPACGPAGR